MYSQKLNCAASLFPKQNFSVLSPNFYTHISVRDLYIFPGSVCLFCCSQICGPFLGIYKSLTNTWMWWMWKLGLRPRNSQKRNNKWDFLCSVVTLTCRRRCWLWRMRGWAWATPLLSCMDSALPSSAQECVKTSSYIPFKGLSHEIGSGHAYGWWINLSKHMCRADSLTF